MVSVEEVKGKKHLVTEIVVDFSGSVNAAQADNVATYRLASANGKGSFTAKNSPVMKIRSAVFNPANDTVTLTPKKALALTKPVQLTINGTSSSGLEDSSGQLIDGDDNGTAGGNAVAVIRRTGVTLNPVAPAPAKVSHPTHPAPSRRSIPIIPAPPVVLSPTPTPTPTSTPTPTLTPAPTPTPTAPPVGYFAVVDAMLARNERMM